MKQIGVILMNLGGPTSLEAVRPFLRNLFLDPELIRFPVPERFFPRRLFAEFVSRRRAPIVLPHYRRIGGGSPIVELTRQQGRALESLLNERFRDVAAFHVRIGMRYWHPFTREAADELRSKGIDEIFLLPLYPQYSRTTTGSSFKEWRDLHRKIYRGGFRVKSVKDYFTHPRYVAALCERMDATLAGKFTPGERPDVHLLFSAHGTPMSDVHAGDPYSGQIMATVEAVMNSRGHDLPHHLSFQSRVGPVKWLEPSTHDTVIRLGRQGVKRLLVVPVAFVTDHIETLHELDIELREEAEAAGVESYRVMHALNASPLFIGALADVVQMRYRLQMQPNGRTPSTDAGA